MSKSYQDTRNKTIRWCDNLLRNGIYDRQQYKECVNSFVDLSGGGKLPEPIRPPKTNNEYSYSLYGKDSNYTTKQLVDTETVNLDSSLEEIQQLESLLNRLTRIGQNDCQPFTLELLDPHGHSMIIDESASERELSDEEIISLPTGPDPAVFSA